MAEAAADQTPSSLQRLELVEKRLADALESAGKALEELGTGAQTDVTLRHSQQFLEALRDVQTALRTEVSSLWDYRPYENCDYVERIGAQLCVEKVEWMEEQVRDIAACVDEYKRDGTQ